MSVVQEMVIVDVPITEINVIEGRNAREVKTDSEEFLALVDSIKRHGILTPLIVTTGEGESYDLVAGHRRLAAAQLLDAAVVPCVVRAPGDELEITAIENLQRQDLTPLEEARAMGKLADAGYTIEGISDAISVTKPVIASRLEILELPERVQELFADASVPVTAAKWLNQVAARQPKAADELVPFFVEEEHGKHNLRSFASGPGEFLTRLAWRRPYFEDGKLSKSSIKSDNGINSLWSGALPGQAIPKLPKKVREAIIAFDKEARPYRHEEFVIELDRDDPVYMEANAAGVILEFEYRGSLTPFYLLPQFFDWLKDSDAVVRLFAEAQDRRRERIESEAKQRGSASGADPKTTKSEERKQADRRLREMVNDGVIRGANLDLGAALINDLGKVKVTPEIARIFALALIGPKGAGYSANTKSGFAYSEDTVVRAAVQGIALCLPDWHEVETTELKSGKKKVIYTYPERTQELEAKVWAWWGRAKTVEEIFGRALVIRAAGMFALQRVLPKKNQSVYFISNMPGNRLDNYDASQALEKLVKKVLPASYKKVRAEIQRLEQVSWTEEEK